MKWLGNIHDPAGGPHPLIGYGRRGGESHLEAWRRRVRWLQDKVIGEPRAMPPWTPAALRRLGYVGVYELEPGDPDVPTFGEQRQRA